VAGFPPRKDADRQGCPAPEAAPPEHGLSPGGAAATAETLAGPFPAGRSPEAAPLVGAVSHIPAPGANLSSLYLLHRVHSR